MRTRRLASHSLLPVALAAATLTAGACLPDGRAVEGRPLFLGRDLVRPAFVLVDDEPSVIFEQRTSPISATGRRTSDVYVVSWGGGQVRKLVSDRSGRWDLSVDRAGFYHYMLAERLFEEGGPGSVPLPVATLARVSLTAGVVDTIPDVVSFSQLGESAVQYRKMVAGSSIPEIRVRQWSTGADHLIGTGSGQVQFHPSGRIYLLSGPERAFTRLPGLTGPPEVLRADVMRFALSGDEGRAMLTVAKDGRLETVLLDVVTRSERTLPIDPCCWSGFTADGKGFRYSEQAKGDEPARLRVLDLTTYEDEVTLTLPIGMADFGGEIARPRSEASLVVDSRRRVALRDRPGAELRLLDVRPVRPTFSDDGRHFFYIDPDIVEPEIEGRLMILPGTFDAPPRQLNPPGTRIGEPGFFFIDGPEPLVFWANYPRGPSDLFFANYETGASRIVAQGISQVTVTRQRIVGIIRVSMQDLTGDLVERDPQTGDEVVYAHAVSEVTFGPAVTKEDGTAGGQRAAFIVRERVASRREGLWATTLFERRMSASGMAGE